MSIKIHNSRELALKAKADPQYRHIQDLALQVAQLKRQFTDTQKKIEAALSRLNSIEAAQPYPDKLVRKVIRPGARHVESPATARP